MKTITILCIVFCATFYVQTAQAEAKFDCLKRVVKEAVGNDPKYTAWFAEVEGSNQNALKMLAMCANLPIEIKPMCYKNVVEFIKGATVTLAKKLSQIDPSKNWAELTKPCVESRT